MGEVCSEGIGQTTLNYTGQRKDGTGLLFYNARYYDPGLARFVSADSVVPGVADGKGGGAATLGYDDDVELRPLTVDFHEPDFASTVGDENAFTLERGFWFQLNDDDRQAAKYQWGPKNPQALNRYAYVLNNPLRYTDPTGHHHGAQNYTPYGAAQLARNLRTVGNYVAFGSALGSWGARKALALLGLGPLGWIVAGVGVQARHEVHQVAELLNRAAIEAAEIGGSVLVRTDVQQTVTIVVDDRNGKTVTAYKYTLSNPVAVEIWHWAVHNTPPAP